MADKDSTPSKDDRKIANQNNQPAGSVTTNARQNSSDVITPHSISASSLMQQQQQNVQFQQLLNNYGFQQASSFIASSQYRMLYLQNRIRYYQSARTGGEIIAQALNMPPLHQNLPGLFNEQIGSRFPGYRQPHYTQNVGQSNNQHAYNPIRHRIQGSSSQNQSFIQGLPSQNQYRSHDRVQQQVQQQNAFGQPRQQVYAPPSSYQQQQPSASQTAQNTK